MEADQPRLPRLVSHLSRLSNWCFGRCYVGLYGCLTVAGVGKSSILLRFTDDVFDDVAPTIGVDFKVKALDVDGRRVKITAWDTGTVFPAAAVGVTSRVNCRGYPYPSPEATDQAGPACLRSCPRAGLLPPTLLSVGPCAALAELERMFLTAITTAFRISSPGLFVVPGLFLWRRWGVRVPRPAAGQERFRTLTSAYYRGAHGVVLVYDVSKRETFDNLASVWLPEVNQYSTRPEVIKMIVGNKLDLASREVSASDGDALARRNGCLFIESSARTATGVRQCFEELVRKVLDTPQLCTSTSAGGGGGGADTPGLTTLGSSDRTSASDCSC